MQLHCKTFRLTVWYKGDHLIKTIVITTSVSCFLKAVFIKKNYNEVLLTLTIEEWKRMMKLYVELRIHLHFIYMSMSNALSVYSMQPFDFYVADLHTVMCNTYTHRTHTD